MKSNKAFIGVSLDNQIFLTDWLLFALKKILSKHDTILFLLADDLLRYTRTSVETNNDELVDYIAIDEIIAKRANKFTHHLENTLSSFSTDQIQKVKVRHWKDYEDNRYNELLRNLVIAFYNVKSFRDDVYALAHQHLKKFSNSIKYDNLLNSSAHYILDEAAMAIRVTEIENYNNEYYPTDDISVLKNLYADKYKINGLTVESLIRQTPKRNFVTINILSK